MAAPKIHISDYYYSTDLDARYADATLKVETILRNYSSVPVQNVRVKATLFDPSGKQNGGCIDI